MIEQFEIHNQFWESIGRFKNFDPHLKKLENMPLRYRSPLIEEKTLTKSGIYVITGGRQVGKTTFLKQMILKLLEEKRAKPENILFLTSEIIDTHHILRRLIEDYFRDKKG